MPRRSVRGYPVSVKAIYSNRALIVCLDNQNQESGWAGPSRSATATPFATPSTPDHFRQHAPAAGPVRSQARQGRLQARAAAPGAEFRWSGKKYFLTYAQVSDYLTFFFVTIMTKSFFIVRWVTGTLKFLRTSLTPVTRFLSLGRLSWRRTKTVGSTGTSLPSSTRQFAPEERTFSISTAYIRTSSRKSSFYF